MSYPSKPSIGTSYTGVEQSIGDGSFPGQEMDVDLVAFRDAIGEVIDFIKLFTRSDGKLANGLVTVESLAPSVLIGIDPPQPWATATSYSTTSTVFFGSGLYLCIVAHTSGVFATDVTAGRWQLLADFTPAAGALIDSNNLSDLTDAALARAALGLGTMATLNTGTGSGQFRTNTQNEALFEQTANLDTAAYTPATDYATAAQGAKADTAVQPARAVAAGTGLLGGGDLSADRTISADIASQAEAEAGASSTKLMTPQRAAQAIAALAPQTRVLLASKTASASASLDFTEFDNATYSRYEIEIENLVPVTDNVALWIRTSTDSGATFDSGASDYGYSRFLNGSNTVNIGDSKLETNTDIGSAANEFGVTGLLRVWHAADAAAYTIVEGDLAHQNAVAGVMHRSSIAGNRKSAAEVDAIQFLFSSGNVESGVIRLYGIVA